MNVDIHEPPQSPSNNQLNLSEGPYDQTNQKSPEPRSKKIEVFLVSSQGKKKIVYDCEKMLVEQIMQNLFLENREFFKNESIYDLNFYVAKKSGEPKDDIPGELNST